MNKISKQCHNNKFLNCIGFNFSSFGIKLLGGFPAAASPSLVVWELVLQRHEPVLCKHVSCSAALLGPSVTAAPGKLHGALGADLRSSEATSTRPMPLSRNGHQWSPAIALSRAVPSLCSSDAESCGFRLREPLIPGSFCKILLAKFAHISAITNFPACNAI